MALVEPLILPIVIVPVPNALALVVPPSVPARMVLPPEKVFTPESVSPEEVLFCITPVTFVPMMALIAVLPVPEPELVMLPVLLIEVPESVTPLAMELLLFRTRFPVPLAPPER